MSGSTGRRLRAAGRVDPPDWTAAVAARLDAVAFARPDPDATGARSDDVPGTPPASAADRATDGSGSPPDAEHPPGWQKTKFLGTLSRVVSRNTRPGR